MIHEFLHFCISKYPKRDFFACSYSKKCLFGREMSIVNADRVTVLMLNSKVGGGDQKFMLQLDGKPCLLSPISEGYITDSVLRQFSNAQHVVLPTDAQLARCIDPAAKKK